MKYTIDEVVYLFELNDGKLTKDHHIIYILEKDGSYKLGETHGVNGRTPIEQLAQRYKNDNSTSFTGRMTFPLIFITNGKAKDDEKIRKSINESNIPFTANYRGYKHEKHQNTEQLIKFDLKTHKDILVDFVKKYYGVGDLTNHNPAPVWRLYQYGVCDEITSTMITNNKALFVAYPSFGKTLVSCEVVCKMLPYGGVCLITTPITDTLDSFKKNFVNFCFGANRKLKICILDKLSDFKNIKPEENILYIILLSAQDLFYDDGFGNIREKYVFDNLDVWIRDERHLYYEGFKTSKKIELINAKYILDLTATPHNIYADYDQIIKRDLLWAVQNIHLTGIPHIKIDCLNKHFFETVPEDIKRLFEDDEEGFHAGKLFKHKGKDFVYKSEIIKMFRNFYVSSLDKTKNPFTITNDYDLCALSKNVGMVVLPSGDKESSAEYCILKLSKLLNNEFKNENMFFISSYEIDNNRKHMTVNEYIETLLKEHTTIIILTHRKYTTGTDIQSLGHIVLLDNINEIKQFEQLLGRLIRIYDGKENVKLYAYSSKFLLTYGGWVRTLSGDCCLKMEEILSSIPLTEYVNNKLVNVDLDYLLNEINKAVFNNTGFGVNKTAISQFIDTNTIQLWTEHMVKFNVKKSSVIFEGAESPGKSKISKKQSKEKTKNNNAMIVELICAIINELPEAIYLNNTINIDELLNTKSIKRYFDNNQLMFFKEILNNNINLCKIIELFIGRSRTNIDINLDDMLEGIK